MVGFNLNAEKTGDMDELDLNAFTIKPDALIYFTIAQIVGIIPKGISQNKLIEEILMMKCLLVDDLEDLCEAQGYIKPDLINDDKIQKDEYFINTAEFEKTLVLDSLKGSDYWIQKSKLARYKFKLLNMRVFGSSAKFKELQY
jgi:hypothetical protein